mgnify:CR=1 FL=1
MPKYLIDEQLMEKNVMQRVNAKLESDLGTGGSYMFKRIVFVIVLLNALLILSALLFS